MSSGGSVIARSLRHVSRLLAKNLYPCHAAAVVGIDGDDGVTLRPGTGSLSRIGRVTAGSKATMSRLEKKRSGR
jgi:hypothetical protein